LWRTRLACCLIWKKPSHASRVRHSKLTHDLIVALMEIANRDFYNADAMTESSSASPPFVSTLAIIGVGLLGGSIAAAAKGRGVAGRVVGIGRDAARLEQARQRGLVDLASTEIEAAGEADLVVVCTPVNRIAADVRKVAAVCRPGTLITDVGSVKGSICRELASGLPAGIEFVGSHPLAGSEKSGFEATDPNLLEGRVCIVTIDESASVAARVRLREFWSRLGARVIEMSPEAHDHVLAETSHLPHLAAAVLASTLQDEHRPLAATGFRDSTRIAAGDANLWTAIFLANADEVEQALDRYEKVWREFRQAMKTRDATALRDLLAKARDSRLKLDHRGT
jgi:prephenate dehydrogenase